MSDKSKKQCQHSGAELDQPVGGEKRKAQSLSTLGDEQLLTKSPILPNQYSTPAPSAHIENPAEIRHDSGDISKDADSLLRDLGKSEQDAWKCVAQLEAEIQAHRLSYISQVGQTQEALDRVVELEATNRQLKESEAQLKAKLAHRHYLGKTYDLTQENFSKVLGELDEVRAENAELKARLAGLEK